MRTSHLLTAVALVSPALASPGDRSPHFETCVRLCATNHCASSAPLPLALRLTHWTCIDDCKYQCMHEITDKHVARGELVQQYFGKWPFFRLGGMQEPASVLFSLFNLWAHARGALQVRRRIPDAHPMKSYYLIWAFTSINAWVWSSVFHTRDLPITEKLDYFSAALAILYALYYTVIRLFHIYPAAQNTHLTVSPRKSTSSNLKLQLWSSLCILVYVSHVAYLSLLPRFDYTYNIIFNLALGVAHNALWLLYASPSSLIRRFPAKPSSYRPSFANKAALFVFLTTGATALELFDFPPWGRIVDAHALWHLSTAPIALFWYDFLVEDALHNSWRGQRT